MSDPIDIKALDEYLKGGGSSDISQRYRELGREDVPPELDRRVLDEARAAVASEKAGRSRSWLKWSAPLALAASVVLVVTVVIESGVQNDASFATKVAQEKPVQPQAESPAQFVPDEPAALPAPPPAKAEPETLAKTARIAKTEEAERRETAAAEEVRADAKAMRDEIRTALPVSAAEPAVDSHEAQVANVQAAPVPSLAGATSVQSVSVRKEVDSEASRAQADSADNDLSTTSTAGTRARRAGRTAGPRSTSTSSALSSETRPAADEDAEQADPVKWLEEIRDLRRAGKSAEADRAWERFHEAFPDFPVAEDDLARKK